MATSTGTKSQIYRSVRFPGLSGKDPKLLEVAEEAFAKVGRGVTNDLWVFGLSLVSLPDDFEGYSRVVSIECGLNPLNRLPASLGKCTGLKRLSCNETELTALPASIGRCVALEEFSCDDSQLKALPLTMAKLSQLKKISCTHNQLQSLPLFHDCPHLNSAAFAGNDWDATWLESVTPPGMKAPEPRQEIPLAWLQG